MKIKTAVLSASLAALIASTGLGYAAYTGQFNIVQWAGAILGAPTAPGTSATGNVLGIQGVTGGIPFLANPGTIAQWGVFGDNSTFTPGTTIETPSGCIGTSTPTTGAITTGHQGATGCTLNREQWIDAGPSSAILNAINAGFDATTGANRIISAPNVTPIDCSGTATATAANAANLGTISIHGFTIQNESTTVNLSYSLTGTAVAGAAGTFTLLPLGQSPNSYTSPVGLGSNHAVSVISTASDIYTCTAF